jgi:thiosulfate dehydrogenase
MMKIRLKSGLKLGIVLSLSLGMSCKESQSENTKSQESPESTTASALAEQNESSKPQWQVPTQRPEGALGAQIAYGEKLISQTPMYLGPDVKDPQMQIAGNHLSCKNCHLQAGQQANAMGFVGVAQRYPRYRGRENREVTLTERVNGCFQRSLNGKKLAPESAEMQAILAYMNWLSEDIPAPGQVEGMRLPEIGLIERAADPEKGKAVFSQHCVVCHQANGQGLQLNPQDASAGYAFPPLWGPDSYNDGAGMHRVITAAKYIKANMPLGNAKLSIEEAYDVAAYINSHERPHKAEREKDYPDLNKKPVDTPYGPYADDFTEQQHKYGPFEPIQTGH